MNGQRARFEPEDLLRTLLRYPSQGTLWVAFSGGIDSTALLLALHELRDRLAAPLAAVHVNHGWHAAAGDWARHCAAQCQALDIPLQLRAVRAPNPGGAGREGDLRQQRYREFEAVLECGDLLLQAHHQDDLAETLLLNLMRGSGPEGLAGIPESRRLGRGRLLRPLLGVRRADLLAFLERRGATWIEDPTNRDQARDRNYLRHQVLPVLRERWPAVDHSLARSAGYCREVAGLATARAQEWVHSHRLGARVLALPPAPDLGQAAVRWGLRCWLRAESAPPLPAARLEEFLRQAEQACADRSAEVRWEGWTLRAWGQCLWLHDPQVLAPCPALPWPSGSSLELGKALGTLSLEGGSKGIPDSAWTVDAARPGQRLQLETGGPHKKIRELLRLAGVPPWLRTCLPVLSQGQETLAVGDRLLHPELRARLAASEARLEWKPKDPVLAWLCRQRPPADG